MKKITFFLLGIFVAALFFAEEKVEIKDGTPFWYVYMEFREGHNEAQRIGDFYQETRKQGIQSRLSGYPFRISFDFPYQVGEVLDVWGIGSRVSEYTQVKPPLKTSQYKYEKIARMIHVGPYETVYLAYNIIIPSLEEKNLEIIGPPLVMWMDDPSQVKPEECRTELIIPVRKIIK